jgi:MoaA/NifB/PqqE/SkfB family radical SAM enzyme
MENELKLPKVLQDALKKVSTASTPQLVKMVKNPLIRKMIVSEVEKFMFSQLKESRSDPDIYPSIQDDRTAMGLAIMGSINRALDEHHLSDAYLRGMLQILVKTLFIDRGDAEPRDQFAAKYGARSPSFLLISPGKACNLRCTGCYADSDNQKNALEWSIVDRMIEEAKTLWGTRFFVISGGEPFAYRSEGKGLLELIEKHQDCFFMAYTNATLINEKVSKQLAEAGNMLLCISVEGWKERTDERRGAGVFDKILETMERLNKDGVPYGLSLTGTCHNAEEILSEEFIDFFMQKGALFAWLFQYMPIGRSFTLDLMVTPEQRAWMWKRSWEIVRERRFFLADFWNHGTCVDGCLSAGGHGNGGYFYIDWNGAISPCVFVPYSPVNIRDIYARGETLNDVWLNPFFKSVRSWQYDFKKNNRNYLAPCPNRDHHDELEQLLRQYEPEPTDTNAAETLIDPEYTRGLVVYNKQYEAIMSSIWENHYMRRKAAKDELLAPLPEIPSVDEKDTLVDISTVLQAEEAASD